MYDDSIFEDNDDDILKSSSSSESSSRGPIPGYLRSALERYVQENPQARESFTQFKETSNLFRFMNNYMTFEQMLIKVHPQPSTGPLLRSVITALDEALEGKVQRLYAVYSLEPIFIASHLNLSMISDTYQAIVDANVPIDEPVEQFLEYLTVLSDIYSFTVRDTATKYYVACERAGIEPDTNLIEYGVKKDADFAFSMSSHTTQLLAHYQDGDVSSITTRYESSGRSGFLKFFLPLILSTSDQIVEIPKENVAGI